MTTLSRKNQWTNADGLVVGFGNRYPERQRTADYEIDGIMKELVLDFTWESTSPALDIPAGFIVEEMYLVVGTAWVSSGTVTIKIGDGGNDDGWFDTTALTEANLVAGATFVADGAYAVSTTELPPKTYSSADTIDVVVSTGGNAPSQGSARLVVVGYQSGAAAV